MHFQTSSFNYKFSQFRELALVNSIELLTSFSITLTLFKAQFPLSAGVITLSSSAV